VTAKRSQKATSTGPLSTSEASPTDIYVTLEEASRLTGLLVERLQNMVRRKLIPYRGGQVDPVFSMATVTKLRAVPVPNGSIELPRAKSTKGVNKPRGARFVVDRVVEGHVLDVIKTMPANSVQSVVTSPPFWGQRVYADEKPVLWQDDSLVPFGRESSPEAYVQHTLEILAAIGRVLKPNGTIWWNLGDSYMTRAIARTSSRDRIQHYAGKRTKWAKSPYRRYSSGHAYLKDKDLTLVPFQVAMGAQRIGYWVRSVIVWSKQHNGLGEGLESRAHVPEVVTDRPVVGHEYILLLARSVSYDYDGARAGETDGDGTALNVRSVWNFKPIGKGGEHGARFPEQLPRRCIQLSTRRGQLVFDPFAGDGNTLIAAKQLGRHFFGCDISPTYIAAARRRLATEGVLKPS
jgi:DNA modification methylase